MKSQLSARIKVPITSADVVAKTRQILVSYSLRKATNPTKELECKLWWPTTSYIMVRLAVARNFRSRRVGRPNHFLGKSVRRRN